MKEKTDLNKRLDEIVSQMKKVSKTIASDGQPPSARELDELTSLGSEYGEVMTQLAATKTASSRKA